MAYALRYQMDVIWVPDGAGPMTSLIGAGSNIGTGVGGGAQVKTIFQAAAVPVPGGDAPSQANFNTAISGAMVTDLEAQIAANLAQIQGFASGGG